jgi:DNA-binding NtrC family response regulator
VTLISPLKDRHILIAEDEPVIALDLITAFTDVGANVIVVRSIAKAMDIIESKLWTGAVLDYRLSDGNCDLLAEWFIERGVPFIIYTGQDKVSAVCHLGIIRRKPMPMDRLVELMTELAVADPITNLQ